jgi:hypothetical protein
MTAHTHRTQPWSLGGKQTQMHVPQQHQPRTLQSSQHQLGDHTQLSQCRKSTAHSWVATVCTWWVHTCVHMHAIACMQQYTHAITAQTSHPVHNLHCPVVSLQHTLSRNFQNTAHLVQKHFCSTSLLATKLVAIKLPQQSQYPLETAQLLQQPHCLSLASA